MNKSSIFFSISVTFISLFLFILISFAVLYKTSEHREAFFNKQRSLDLSHIILKELRKERKITNELREHLVFMDFELIKDKDTILNNTHRKTHWVDEKRKAFVSAFELDGKNYIHIHKHRINILFLDKIKTDNFRLYASLIFFMILVAFMLLYFNTIKKLRPLSILQERIKNIGEEDFDIECANDEKDEISQLSNEFDKSVKKLKVLKESRNVFIRNIMHELKTPIAKGQLLAQLPRSDENVESMQKVFYRLESLINEFASIEELISSKKVLHKKEYLLSDIIDNAKDLLMSDETNVIEEFADLKINTDFKLLSIAIKNLMDNAIKYSPDNKVTIKTEGSTIVFQNRGNKLLYPLDEYFEPFFREGKIETNQSFGLGLYIVKHILDANGLELKYEYVDGVNHFKI